MHLFLLILQDKQQFVLSLFHFGEREESPGNTEHHTS